MDRLLAIIALATLIAFLATIAGFVPDPDLITIFALVAILAICDFWKTIWPTRK